MNLDERRILKGQELRTHEGSMEKVFRVMEELEPVGQLCRI